MPTIKTEELAGAALDWAVAHALGLTKPGRFIYGTHDKRTATLETADFLYDWENAVRRYSPSTDWAIAGPIIERERINLEFCRDLRDRNGLYIHAEMETHRWHGYWRGDHNHPLVAAMRCFVYSKLGESVEIPAELDQRAAQAAQGREA